MPGIPASLSACDAPVISRSTYSSLPTFTNSILSPLDTPIARRTAAVDPRRNIVLEASADEGSRELTFDEVRDAVELAPGAYQLRSGEVLLFLNPPTIH